jgi:hypothetical protein
MYIESLIAAGKKPDLFVDWHNNTNEYFYYPSVSDPDLLAAVSRMLDMLHEYSWFTGPANTGANWATTGQMWLHYGIYSIAFEHNIDWIDGLDEPNGTPSAGKVPYGEDWELFGQQFCEVLYRYFDLSPQP